MHNQLRSQNMTSKHLHIQPSGPISGILVTETVTHVFPETVTFVLAETVSLNLLK